MTVSLRTPSPASDASLPRTSAVLRHDTGDGAIHRRMPDDQHFSDALIERTVRGVEAAVREWHS